MIELVQKQLKFFLELNEGINVNSADTNDIIKELYKTNFFKNVSIEIK